MSRVLSRSELLASIIDPTPDRVGAASALSDADLAILHAACLGPYAGRAAADEREIHVTAIPLENERETHHAVYRAPR